MTIPIIMKSLNKESRERKGPSKFPPAHIIQDLFWISGGNSENFLKISGIVPLDRKRFPP
jgi:hypothetical protein